jgi:hypothetical protein
MLLDLRSLEEVQAQAPAPGGYPGAGGIVSLTRSRGPITLRIPEEPRRRRRIRVRDQAAVALFAAGAISEDELAVLLAA